MTASTYRWLGVAMVLAVAAAYLGPKIFDNADTVDFKYIWLAGSLWREGLNPYADVFREQGGVIFAGANHPQFWVYPPNWWPIATGFSALPYEPARMVWRVASAGALLIGCFSVSRTLRRQDISMPEWRHILFWGICATMSATAVTVNLGQTSLLAFLGICLFIAAMLRQDRAMMVAALVILALKPTLGMVLLVALLPARFWWGAILAAGVITLAMAASALVQDGVGNVLGAMLDRLGEYGREAVNSPPEMTGLRHLVDRFAGVELGTLSCIGLGMIASFLTGILAQREAASRDLPEILALLLVVTAVFVPMHTYDLIFVALLFVLSAGLPRVMQSLFVLGVLLLWRANNFEMLTGLTDPETIYSKGSLLSSVVLLSMLIALIARRATMTRLRQVSG